MATRATCGSAKDDLVEARPKGIEEEEYPFYPRNVLLKSFSALKVEQVLGSFRTCTTCKEDLGFLQSMRGRIDQDFAGYVKRIMPSAQNPDNLAASSICLFALMVYIGHPLLIIPFIDQKRNDSNVLDSYASGSFSHPNLLQQFWPDQRESSGQAERKSRLLATEIRENISKFVRPILDDELFTVLGHNTKPPFYAEQWLGAGSFGNVYSFRIYDGYNRLPNFRDVHKFARKQIRAGDDIGPLAYHLERRNLEIVKRLKDKHIVEIASSYRDGQGRFNLVFPCATANLHDCLRDKRYNFNSSLYRPGPLWHCPLWGQLLGVAQALHRIAAGTSESSGEAEHDLIGYHFDLKPANILVYRQRKKWTFKITDFGQAKFKRASGGNSNTHRKGGDEEYAPPEIDDGVTNGQEQNRKYDVFSLGCILLELTFFIVKGYDGVAQLDEARGKCSGPGQSDGRYCVPQTDTTPASLKPQISIHMKNLPFSMQDRTMFATDEKDFIEEILKIIRGMLEPNTSHRYTSREVVQRLQALLGEKEKHAPSGAPNAGGSSFELEKPRSEEEEIGQPGLRRLKLYARANTDRNRGDTPIHLQIFENNLNHLRFVTTMTNLQRRGPCGQGLRHDIELLPQYAARKDDDMTRTNAGLRLVWANNPQQPIMEVDFNAVDLDNLRILHGILMAQEICHSVDLENATYSTPFSVKDFARNQWGKFKIAAKAEDKETKSTSLSEREMSSFTLQLWRDEEKSSNSHTCRLVFYSAEQIIVIPFDDAWRLTKLEKSDQDDETRRDIKIEPTRPQREDLFQMSILGAQGSGAAPPRFPVDRAMFIDLLKSNERQFLSFSLTFRNHTDLMDFWNVFGVRKQAEQQERGIFSARRS